jgi:hypothetical protein
MSLTNEDLSRMIDEIERQTGKFVSSAEIKDGKIVSYELASFGPNDLVLDVWNCVGKLCRAVSKDNSFKLKFLYYDDSRIFWNWCAKNCYRAGGAINMSGIYPVVIPIPNWLKTRLITESLGKKEEAD